MNKERGLCLVAAGSVNFHELLEFTGLCRSEIFYIAKGNGHAMFISRVKRNWQSGGVYFFLRDPLQKHRENELDEAVQFSIRELVEENAQLKENNAWYRNKILELEDENKKIKGQNAAKVNVHLVRAYQKLHLQHQRLQGELQKLTALGLRRFQDTMH